MKPRPRCLKCNRALQAIYAQVQSQEAVPGGFKTKSTRGVLLGYGYGASGHFCSKTCGHRWAVTLLRSEPLTARVVDVTENGGGPWKLFVGDYGCAVWPSVDSAHSPQLYAEEVARCINLALQARNK